MSRFRLQGCFLAVLFAFSSAVSAQDYFMVPERLAGQLPAGSEVVHDYNDRLLVQVPADRLAPSLRRQISELEDTRYLSYRTWRGPVDGHEPGTLPELLDSYFLLGLIGPMDARWRGQIEASGLVIVDHVNPYGLLVRGGTRSVQQAAQDVLTSHQHRVITHALTLPEDSRVAEDLKRWLAGRSEAADLGLRTEGDQVVIQVVSHTDANVDRFSSRVQDFLQQGPEFIPGRDSAQFLASRQTLSDLLAQVPEVAFVEGEYPKELHNNISPQPHITNVQPVWEELNYTGAGVIAGVNDSGMDLSHADFPAGAVVATQGAMSNTDNGHGTHVTGTVAGRGAHPSPLNTSGCGDVTAPLADARGVAWQTQIVHNNLFDGGISDEAAMMQWQSEQGAVVNNNSWGYGSIVGPATDYGVQTVAVDRAVRDAQPGTGVNDQLAIVFSAGNSAAQGVSKPGNGKNVITVGASQNDRCGSYIPSRCSGPDIEGMACFSSHGPSQGRAKPDIVAPGTDVLSTGSSDPQATWGGWDQPWTGPQFAILPGTSMSAPQVTGASAIFHQYYQDVFNATPSPALVKAALINTATHLSTASYPSNIEGWGRMNLRKALEGPIEDGIVYFDQDDVDHLQTGQSWTIEIGVASADEPLRITLVWTDPPGAAGCTTCHINDLDLIVTAPDGVTVYRGNQFTGIWSTANPAGRDGVNNVENIFIEAPMPGDYTVEINAFNVAQNPSLLSGQDFALVATGDFGGIKVDPTVAAACIADGSIDFTLTLSGQFEGTTNLSATGEPAGAAGSFNPNPVVFPVVESLYTLSGLGSVAGGEYVLEFSAVDSADPDNFADAAATLSVFEANPGQPLLQNPGDGATNVDLRPGFAWNPPAEGAQYRIQVATDAGFADIVIDETVAAIGFTPGADLATGTNYFWRVRAMNACGDGDWSAVFEFQTRFEPIADISPDSFSFNVQTGDTASQPLFIENIGTGELAWQIGTDEIEGDCTDPTLVPWLSGDPDSGSTPPGPPAEPGVIVDANQLTHGQHEANLCVTTNTTAGPQLVVIPVFVNAIDPSIAFLEGNINSLGLCGTDGEPLEGALVSVQGQDNVFQQTTDENGFYSFEISEDESPVTITVSADLHFTEVRPDVVLTGGQLNIENFDLNGDSACIEVEPDEISVTLEINQSGSDTLEISNVGTQTLDWEILFNEITALSAARSNLLINGALLIPDSSNRRVLAFDPETGDLLDENFVPPQTETLGTIQHMLLHPDNERLLLSTQSAANPVVWGFDLDGTLLGPFAPAGGGDPDIMQNLRGMNFHPGTGHLLVSTSAGGNPDSITEFDLDGNFLGTFIASGAGGLSNPWHLEFRADDVLVAGVISGGIWRFDHSGAPLGTWGPPLSFPRQIVVLENGNVLVTNSSGTGTTGVYEFDADGNQLAYYDVAGAARGVFELGNGNLLVSNADGVHEIDRDNNLVETKFTAGSHHLISFAKFSCDEATLSWVSASPGGGSIAAGDPAVSVTVDFDASGLAPGVYSGDLCVDSNDPVNPRVQVPVSMEVVLTGDIATLEGTVQTAGFCGAGELVPLAGATVEATSVLGTHVATTDGNGLYQFFLPESESPVDITVTAADHLEQTVTGVTFTGGEVVVNDFDLDGDSACIDVDPQAIDDTLEIGQTADHPVQIANTGSQTLDWAIGADGIRGGSDRLIGFNFISASGATADPQNWTRISDPDGFVENVPDDTGEPTEVNIQWGAVSGSGPLYVSTSTLTDNAVPQHDYDLSGMVGYGFRGNTRFFIELSGLRPNTPHEYWLVAYRGTSAIDQTVQVSDGDDLNAIEFDQAITGAANSGRFIVNDVLADDTMHWNNLAFQTTSSSAGTLRIEWEGDSQSTTIGAFAVRPLLDCDLPGWLSLDPVSGSVGAGDPPETVTATLAASGLALGEYQALVCIESNDPTRPEVQVPVDLVVVAGDDHGTIEGEVLSLGHCSDNPHPIFDAVVEVSGQSGTFSTTTDANGLYQIAVPASESPVDILVTAAGHHGGEATGVGITGGEAITVNFSLVLDQPCIEVDPPQFNFEVVQGDSAGEPLTISNTGAADLDWSIAMTAPPGIDCANPTNIDWLSVGPASGTAEPGSASETDVLVDAGGLVPGNYVAVLCVSSNDLQTGPVQVPVGLTVTRENPIADINPDFFEFEVAAGDTAGDTLNIGNIGAGDLIWNIDTADTGASATAGSEAVYSVLVREGDAIPGYGTVVSVFDISVNNEGDWLVEVSYTPAGGGTAQRLVLKNGQPLIAAGEPVPPLPSVVSTPAGTSTALKALNNHGSTAFRLSLSDGPASAGMYHDLMPFVLQGDISAAPQLSPDTPYAGFFRARLDDSGRLLLVATVNDSELPGSSNRVLMWFEPDGAGGWDENVLAVQQVALPGMSGDEVVGQIGSNDYSFRIDHDGNALYAVNIGNAASDVNGALYYNDTMVIRKGNPSPLADSNYGNIGDSTRADMNSLGELVFRVDLTGLPSSENTAIVLGHVTSGDPEVLFIRQSEQAPGTDETITGFGSGTSVRINDAGEVLWYANLTGDADTNQALFVDDQVLVRKGVTRADGDLITTVAGVTTAATGGGITRGFTASDNGRYVLLRAMLEGGDRAAVLVDRAATPGCNLPSDVPWLGVSSDSGTTAPGDTDAVDVLIDTAGLAEGEYEALLCVTTNDPVNEQVIVPVTLNVTDTMLGDLEGTVTGAGYCGADPQPLAGAAVSIVGQSNTFEVTTDGDGFYSIPINPDESPVDITVSAADHHGGSTTGVIITAGDTTVQNFELVLDAPCATVDPEVLEAEVGQGGTTSQPLVIGNVDGGGDLIWTIAQAEPETGGQTYRSVPLHPVAFHAPVGSPRGADVPPVDGVADPIVDPVPRGGPIADDWDEGFEDISLLPALGWAMQNNSQPLGTTGWMQGSTAFDAHQGPADSYIAANFQNGAAGGMISNWLLTPEIVLRNGTELRFWTRHSTSTTFPDRMQVRLSVAGASTDVGTTATSVGDFDILLLDINEAMVYPGYPEVWTEFVVTLEGLAAPASGRFAFRYYSPDWETVGSLIGIDTLSVTQPESPCHSPSDVPWLTVDPDSGTTPAGGTHDVTVNFDATGLESGMHEALLCVNSSDSANPQVEVPVALTVLDQAPAELAVDPDALDFDTVSVGQSATGSFVVRNAAGEGAADLVLELLAVTGGDHVFEITGGDCAEGMSLAPEQSCTVEVAFTPLTEIAYTGIVTVQSMDNQSAEVLLSGAGSELGPGELELSPAELDFGEVTFNTTATDELTLTNIGEDTLPVMVDNILVTGEAFADTGNGSCQAGVTELEPGDSCTIEVAFTPSAVNSFTGGVVADGAGGKLAMAALSGAGIDPGDTVFTDRFEAGGPEDQAQ